MATGFCLSSASSTTNPCLLILRDKGYKLQVTSERQPKGEDLYIYVAEKDGRRFAGNSSPELLGLVNLWEIYGENWNRQEPDLMDEIVIEEAEDIAD
jgi:hypothetical protein